MTFSLRTRLLLAHILVIAVVLAAMTGLVLRQQRAWVEEQTLQALERDARAVAGEAPARADWPALAARWRSHLGWRVTLVDRSGRVLGDSDLPADRLGEVENHAVRPEVAAALAGRIGRATRRSATLADGFAYVAAPAPAGSEVAVVRMATHLSALGDLRRALLGNSLAAALLALLLGVPLLAWVTGRHVARIRELEGVTRQLGQGGTARAPERPFDEVGRLGRSINQMAADARARLEALEGERDEREHILAHMSDGVALIDPAGHVIHMNRRMAELLGQPLPAGSGTPFGEFVRSPELEDLIQSARRRQEAVEGELRLWAAGQRVVRATATPLSDANRESVLLVLHDLTEAERVNQIRQDFVANVSHELRTPLTSLRGYAETLLDGALEDVEHRGQFVRVIRDQAVRLEAIACDLLSLAELERPGARPRLEAMDLRELAERQLGVFRSRTEKAGLSLTMTPGLAATVSADRLMMEQVLANLLDNAVKYTERGGVTVSLGMGGGRVFCEVEDTGPGIPEADQARVFERFYRVDKARSREQGGTGLGLSIVKHILALHGGEVSVRSRPGGGSVFHFEIPAGGPG